MNLAHPVAASARKPAGLQMLRRFVIFLSEKHGIDSEKGVTLVPPDKVEAIKGAFKHFKMI